MIFVFKVIRYLTSCLYISSLKLIIYKLYFYHLNSRDMLTHSGSRCVRSVGVTPRSSTNHISRFVSRSLLRYSTTHRSYRRPKHQIKTLNHDIGKCSSNLWNTLKLYDTVARQRMRCWFNENIPITKDWVCQKVPTLQTVKEDFTFPCSTSWEEYPMKKIQQDHTMLNTNNNKMELDLSRIRKYLQQYVQYHNNKLSTAVFFAIIVGFGSWCYYNCGTSTSLWSWILGNGLIWAKMWYHNTRKKQFERHLGVVNYQLDKKN